MKRSKLVILPVLHDYDGDISKQWFVFYTVRNPRTNKMQRFKIYGGINRHHDFDARRKAAFKICSEFTEKLKMGWSPFKNDSKII
jgi:hypothetical protein